MQAISVVRFRGPASAGPTLHALRWIAAGASFLAAWALFAPSVHATPSELLADLKAETPAPERFHSAPEPLAAFGPPGQARLLVFADDGRHGAEPWVTDGTGAGTRLLADLYPGPFSSFPMRAVALADGVVFGARDASGHALWSSDGTRTGTLLLTRGKVQAVEVFRGTAYAILDRQTPDRRRTYELWATRGTPETTRRVLDLCETQCGWFPAPLTAASGTLYFVAQREETGFELWRSDGTAVGSESFSDLCDGPCTSPPAFLTPFDGRLLFFLHHGRGPPDAELWATAATGSSARRIADVQGEIFLPPAATEEQLYFVVDGDSIWVSDGTPAGTAPRIGGAPRIRWLEALGDTVLYADEISGEHRLSRIAPAGDHFEITPLASGFREVPETPTLAGDEIFFLARDESRGRELWVTRGTAASTAAVTDFPPSETTPTGPRGSLGALGGRVLFQALDEEHGSELWISDGSPAGTRLVRDLNPAIGSSDAREFASDNDHAYFVADADGIVGGRSLWRTDGTAGTVELLDESALWGQIVAGAGRVFAFGRPDASAGDVLGVVDGNSVRELASLDGDRGSETVTFSDRLFFATFGEGQELWVSDGTEAGTRVVVDVNPDWQEECFLAACPPVRTLPDELTPVGDRLYFVAQSPDAEDPELWVTDGSTGGTHRVGAATHLAPRSGLAALDGAVVLIASTPGHGTELWVTDRTEDGTRRLTDLPADFELREIVPGAGGALFTVRDDTDRDILWRTDGTPDGTVRISTLEHAGFRSRVHRLIPSGGSGDRVDLVVNNGALGLEPWTSDGTAVGTRPVADLHPGPQGSNPEPVGHAGNRLLFAADGDEAGYELWITDGTEAGTFRLTDVASGLAASNPSAATIVADRVVFAADDGEHGVEPWATDLPTPGDPGVPPPPAEPPLTSPAVPGFRVWVRITASSDGSTVSGTRFEPCIPEILCVAGRLPDRAEVFVRIVGPKPNGRLWPTLVKFTTSTVEVWIEQIRTGETEYYHLEGASPGFDVLPGLFDRQGFEPPAPPL